MVFKGNRKTASVLHGKVITSGFNQAGQNIIIVSNLSSYIEDKSSPHWAESSYLMLRETLDNFVPADAGRSAYGASLAGVLYEIVVYLIKKKEATEIGRYGVEA